MMGAERRSMVMTEEEKRLTAYREGGRALVALNMEASDPVHKATIIPRGRGVGRSWCACPNVTSCRSRAANMKADLAVAHGRSHCRRADIRPRKSDLRWLPPTAT